MNTRQIRKNIAKNYFIFEPEMYTSLPGSIVITSYILSEEKPEVKDIRKKWKYFVRHGFNFDFTDENYISKVCEAFGLKMFPLELAAYVQSEYNALIVPYIEDDKGNKNILPLREDGIYTRTLRVGKIYPLTEKVV